MLFELVKVLIVKFITMAMAFAYMQASINLRGKRTLFYVTGICAESHRSALHRYLLLLFHHIDHSIISTGNHLCGVSLPDTQYIPGKFNCCHLHTKANPKKWQTR